MRTERNSKVSLFGFNFDKVTLRQAVQRVLELADGVDTGHYVVTPNLDHAVVLHQRPELLPIYDEASLVLADGQSIVLASRWFRRPLPERVTGSDLVPAVFESARRPLRVFLLGAGPGIAKLAAQRIESQFPQIQIAGVHSPPLGFETSRHENEKAVSLVNERTPDLLVVGLGAPKQELFAYRERHRLGARVILCVGATIDFLASERARAPEWCQRFGLEWLYRTLEEPRRLAPRYAKDAALFPQLLLKQLMSDMGLS
jgi:N-acetylglucosaminyldiphosphoundecaprenol N-acetyl-beta-D-mannosaminyltransferase